MPEFNKSYFFPRWIAITLETFILAFTFAITSDISAKWRRNCPQLFECGGTPREERFAITANKLEIMLTILMFSHLLKAIHFFYGSDWNHNLQFFLKAIKNTSLCICMSYIFAFIMYWTDPKNSFEISFEYPNSSSVMMILYFIIIYCLSNMQLEFKQINENIIFYKIFTTIAMSAYNVPFNQSIDDCDKVLWYSSKTPFARIVECYPAMVNIQKDCNLQDLFFLCAWTLAVLFNCSCGNLAGYLSRKGKNLCLTDNHPFLSLHDITEDEYTNQFGNVHKLKPFVPELKEVVEIQKLATNFEKKIANFKSSSSNKTFRMLKKKLKIADVENMFVYQAIWKPHVFRWIF